MPPEKVRGMSSIRAGSQYRTDPALGVKQPDSTFSNVVLPDPDSPTTLVPPRAGRATRSRRLAEVEWRAGSASPTAEHRKPNLRPAQLVV